MKPLSVLRNSQYEQMLNQLNVLNYIIEHESLETFRSARLAPDRWTVAEIIGHLLDCERLFVIRAKLVLEQDNPELPMPPPEVEVEQGRYNEADLLETLNKLRQTRNEYIAFLKTVESEEQWERPGVFPTGYEMTLNDQLSLACWHTVLHIEQIFEALAQSAQHGM